MGLTKRDMKEYRKRNLADLRRNEREKDYIKIAEARIKPFMEQTKLNDVKV